MDAHDHPDANVVNLHCRYGLDEQRREQIASTIFAEQDEIYTFSHGNLVPPTPSAPPAEPEGADDPFFEQQLRRPHARTRAQTSEPAEQQSETDAYFEQLASESATEMAQRLDCAGEQAKRLPGSALLAASEPAPVRCRRPRASLHPRLNLRRPSMSVAISASVALLTTAAVVLMVVLSSGTPVPSPAARTPDLPAASMFAFGNPFALLRSATSDSGQARLTSRHGKRSRSTAANRRSRHETRRARGSNVTASHAKHRAVRPAASTDASTTSQVQTEGTAAGTSTPAPTEPATSSSDTGSSASGGASTTNTSRTFGLGGTLGPGHSSIG